MISEQEFTVLWEKHYYTLFLYAKGKIGREDVSQDIVTDCFLKIWANPEFMLVKGDKIGPLYKMVRNRMIDYFREVKYKGKIIECTIEQELISDDDSAMIEAEFLSIIYNNLSRIPKRQRQVLQYFMNGLSTSEIAAILNISTQNVLSSKTYGINRLKQLIHV